MADFYYILGVPNFANYEASTALIRIPKQGGDIEYVCIGEDRLTRLKHTYMFPLRGIDYCLRHFGLESLQQVDYIATDYARVPRWLNSGPGYRKLEHDYLKVMLKFPRERILVLDHHDAHAASCYYPSGFDEAGVLVVDGMGSELNTQTAYHFRGNDITWVERGYDWGVGRLYSFVTGAILPYGPEKGYGKVMGLAAYGQRHEPVNLPIAGKLDGMRADYSHLFSRYPTSRLTVQDIPQCTDRQEVMKPPFPRIAYDTQLECEDQLLAMAEYIHRKTGTRKLCIAGGVALNGRANYRIEQETPIERVWVQPACSDTGIPFGLALWAWFQQVGPSTKTRPCRVAMPHAYCGSPYSADDVDETLDRYDIHRTPIEAPDVANLVAGGKVVALFVGGSEYGPRALGHRSILADPRDRRMFDHLNSSVKFREPYRPYAPVVLEEHVSEYFKHTGAAPFMLRVADVVADKHDVIPAVTHVDGTARIQTVTREANGVYYDIVRAFYDITGVPVLLNTSFNVNREPIVETVADALICAFSTSIDYLVVEGRLIDCERYRDPQLVQRVRDDREADLSAQYAGLTRKYLYQYDADEMERYLEEENHIAEWHRKYRAKYELEQAMVGWRRDKVRVLVCGSRNHTKCLYLYIPEFPSLDVIGFVPCDDLPGEQGDFHDVYPEMALDDVPWDEVGAVLVSSHEYQRELTARLQKAVPRSIPVVTLYDDACDSLLYVLPEAWPVLNPADAARHGLSMVRVRQRTASNIDFDFEPTKTEIKDRYAIAINYHLLRNQNGGRFRFQHHETPDRFRHQLARLSENFSFCRTRDLVDPNATLPESNIVITFDDGSKDVLKHAAPIMRRYEVTGSVYVCAQPYLDQRVLSVHKIELLKSKLGLDEFRARFYAVLETRFPSGVEYDTLDYAGAYQFYRYDDESVRAFKLDLNYRLPYKIVNSVLDTLFAMAFGHDVERAAVRQLYLTVDDLKRLMDDGLEIGVHTHHHCVLPRLSYAEQRRELQTVADFLQEVTGEPARTAAYPHGFADQHTKRAMKELDFQGGVTMGRQLITPDAVRSRWELPRYDVNDCFDRTTNELAYDVFAHLSTGD